jgi:aspartate ammonia-lyase
VNQTACQVIGNDLTIPIAAKAGQLQLNMCDLAIMINILQFIRILMKRLAMRWIAAITAKTPGCKAALVKVAFVIHTDVQIWQGTELGITHVL